MARDIGGDGSQVWRRHAGSSGLMLGEGMAFLDILCCSLYSLRGMCSCGGRLCRLWGIILSHGALYECGEKGQVLPALP